MQIEAITFEENGQAVINWDALELLTNKETSESVKYFMDVLGYKFLDFKDADTLVRLILEKDSMFAIYKYYKTTNHLGFSMIAKFEMKEILELVGEKCV